MSPRRTYRECRLSLFWLPTLYGPPTPRLPPPNHIYNMLPKVAKKIRDLCSTAAPGPDKIGPALLQELNEEVAPILAIIFQKSLVTGDVPADWRTANVMLIFKKGAKPEPGNYHPVSLTSICCKILESTVRGDLMEHLLRNRLLRDSQHGFRSKKCCVTNLLEFLEKVTSVVDSGGSMDVVFLEFAKAFDKVPHRRLLVKLGAHGVKGRVLRWIKHWLADRKQRVVLNGKSSDWKSVVSGVPQGSLLGPILFLVFINNLDVQAALVTIIQKFANDTKLGLALRTDSDRELLAE
jgi:hypothetical protein